jgi:hypothetical protein
MMNHDGDNVASFGGGGQIPVPTVNNNSVVVEKTSGAFYAEKTDSSTERVFALDYAKLRQNYTLRLWLTGIYYVFLAYIIIGTFRGFARNNILSFKWNVLRVLSFLVLLGGAWWLLYHVQNRARRTVHQQHVVLTTTGIRYDKHNFPVGSTFHTTIHVRFICLV